MSAWFVFERWTFSKHLGKKWLMDVLNEITYELRRVPPFKWMTFSPSKHWKRTKRSARALLLLLSATLSNIGNRFCSRSDAPSVSDDDVEKGREIASPIETVADPQANAIASAASNKASSSAERLSSILLNNAKAVESTPASPTSPGLPSSVSAVSLSIAPSDTAASTESTGQTTLTGKRRFASVVRGVMTANRVMGVHSPISPLNGFPMTQRTKSSGGKEHEELVVAPNARVSRVASLIPALKSLQPTQLFQPHTALVRHLQFSPNGEFLATCR